MFWERHFEGKSPYFFSCLITAVSKGHCTLSYSIPKVRAVANVC